VGDEQLPWEDEEEEQEPWEDQRTSSRRGRRRRAVAPPPPGHRAAAAGPEQVGLGCTVGNFCLWMRRKWELYMDG